jgi:uncharacterized protein with HEPN domain
MSSSRPTWNIRIRHIIEAALEILQLTEGMTFEQFCRTSTTMHACAYDFIIIGEAVRYVPAEVIAANPEVPWVRMRAMRNVVVHE